MYWQPEKWCAPGTYCCMVPGTQASLFCPVPNWRELWLTILAFFYLVCIMYFLFTTNTPPQPLPSSITGIMWFLMMPVIERLIGYLNILQVNKFQKVSFAYHFIKEFERKLYTVVLFSFRSNSLLLDKIIKW